MGAKAPKLEDISSCSRAFNSFIYWFTMNFYSMLFLFSET